MRRVIHKCFWVWDFEKEEKWINELSSKGLELVSVSYCRYVFEEGGQGQYSYRLELLKNMPSHAESIQYIRFLEDTGVEYIGNVIRWAYFRKKVDTAPFNLFSDYDSLIRHLNKIFLLILPFFFMELGLGISNLMLFWDLKRIGGNLYAGMLCILLAVLFGYGLLKIFSQKKRMKKEHALYE